MESRSVDYIGIDELVPRTHHVAAGGDTEGVLPGSLSHYLEACVEPGVWVSAGHVTYTFSYPSGERCYSLNVDDDLLYLGEVNPYVVNHVDKLVWNCLLQPGVIGRFFPVGKHYLVLSNEVGELQHYYFTTRFALAMRLDANDLPVCDVVEMNGESKLGEGTFAEVYSIHGTVKYRYDESPGIKFKAGQDKSVIKLGLEKFKTGENYMASILAEYDHAKRCQHLRVREPLFGMSLEGVIISGLPMRHLPGRALSDVINDDFAVLEYPDLLFLSLDDRFQLTIAVLHALINQIHDNGLIHRDIKPENILVHRDAIGWHANIVDVNLAQSIVNKDSARCGTAAYIPFEGLSGGYCRSSDVFSMCLVVALLWRDLNQYKLSNIYQADLVLDERYIANWKVELNLFEGLDELSDENKRSIHDVLSICLNKNFETRLNAAACLKNFEVEYLLYRKRVLVIPEKDHGFVDAAMEAGWFARDILKKIANDITVSGAMAALKACLHERISPLAESSFAISEFLRMLQVKSFQGIETKEALVEKIDAVFYGYYAVWEKLTGLYRSISEVLYAYDSLTKAGEEFFIEKEDRLAHYKTGLATFIDRMATTRCDVDSIVEATTHINHKVVKVTAALRYFRDSLPQPERVISPRL